MNKHVLLLILFSFILKISSSSAFVQSRASNGNGLRWASNTPSINLVVETSKSVDLNATQVMSVLNQSILQYSFQTPISFTSIEGVDAPDVSSISFTTEPYFGAGILAITSVAYNSNTGEIKEADVLVNENYTFSSSATASSGTYYLGDVLTHELGHLLGLSHSEVHDSTMMFTAFRGQWSLAEDDSHGLNDLYAVQGLGSISGKVVTGTSPTAFFGAKIEVISSKLGKVVGSSLSLADGAFSVGGLPLDDTYFIYVSPLKSTSSIPAYFSSVISKVCSGNSFRGSFFTKCGESELDRPQGIHLSAAVSNIDVGKVSIRCNFSTSFDYLDDKSAVTRPERSLFDYHHETGGVLSGVFFNYEKLGPLVTTYSDSFTVDLSTVSSPSGKNLDLQFISQSLFSPLAVSIYVTRTESALPTQAQYSFIYSSTSPTYTLDMIENLNRHLTIPLSTSSNENVFTIKIVPVANFTPSQLDALFPSASLFLDNLSPYLLIAGLSQGGNVISSVDHTPYSDNSSCSEKTNNTAVVPFTTNKDLVDSSLKKGAGSQNQAMACATVNFDGGGDDDGQSGPMSLVIGFFSILLLIKLKKSWSLQKD
jgi:predicted Zn-dependent protease